MLMAVAAAAAAAEVVPERCQVESQQWAALAAVLAPRQNPWVTELALRVSLSQWHRP
jgi:hypothetical protein